METAPTPSPSDPLVDASWWIGCEICAQKTLALYDILAISDELVAKGLLVPEMAQIARIEDRLRQLLLAQWRVRARQAIERSHAVWMSSGNLDASMAAVDVVMAKWADDVKERYTNGLTDIYVLGREAGTNRAIGAITQPLDYTVGNFTEELGDQARIAKAAPPRIATAFDVYDASAVTALMDEQMLWIGRHYGANVSDTIRRSAREQIVGRGLGRADTGRLLREDVARNLDKVTVPKGFNGSQAKYFEGLAANAATVGRVRGQIRSFQDLGVTRYILANPMDRRTTRQCIHMNGKVFTVQNAANQIEREAGATRPDDIKRDHPWLSMSRVLAISPVAGRSTAADSGKLAAAGFSLPPFHFRCRTTVDIAPGAAAFSPLTKQEQRLVVPVKPRPAPKPRPAAAKPLAKPKPTKKPTTTPRPVSAARRPATMPPADPLAPLRAPVDSFEPLGGGINTSELLTLNNGTRGVWKSELGESASLRNHVGGPLYKRESAAWKADQAIGAGVVPRTTVRTYGGEVGSIQEFTPAKAYFDATPAAIASATRTSWKQLSLLDVIIANQDRHQGNVMVQKIGRTHRFVAIDNGHSMTDRHLSKWWYNGRHHSSFANKREIQPMMDFASRGRQLAAVDLKVLAQALKDEGIERTAAKAVVGRTAALQKNPSSLSQAIAAEPGTDTFVAVRETTSWIEDGWKVELGRDGIASLNRLMSEVYP